MEMCSRYITYEEVYEIQTDRRIFCDELPVQSIVSLPMPTLRWTQPMLRALPVRFLASLPNLLYRASQISGG